MLETLVAPNEMAISLSQACAYLRIAQSGDDYELTNLIKAAIERIEKRHFKALAIRKVRQSFSSVEILRAFEFAKLKNSIPILRPDLNPITQITSVRKLDFNGQYIEENNLIKFTNGFFELNNFVSSIQIEYFAGYENLAEIPYSLKLLVLEELARIIEVRDNEEINSKNQDYFGARI